MVLGVEDAAGHVGALDEEAASEPVAALVLQHGVVVEPHDGSDAALHRDAEVVQLVAVEHVAAPEREM